jgi:hypothetical protein
MDGVKLEQGAQPILASDEHAAFVRRLEELRTIRDRDLPELLGEARTFVASDADEEILQIQNDLALVSASIERLEQLVRTARLVTEAEP